MHLTAFPLLFPVLVIYLNADCVSPFPQFMLPAISELIPMKVYSWVLCLCSQQCRLALCH